MGQVKYYYATPIYARKKAAENLIPGLPDRIARSVFIIDSTAGHDKAYLNSQSHKQTYRYTLADTNPNIYPHNRPQRDFIPKSNFDAIAQPTPARRLGRGRYLARPASPGDGFSNPHGLHFQRALPGLTQIYPSALRSFTAGSNLR
jgi:hypothetical protein